MECKGNLVRSVLTGRVDVLTQWQGRRVPRMVGCMRGIL